MARPTVAVEVFRGQVGDGGEPDLEPDDLVVAFEGNSTMAKRALDALRAAGVNATSDSRARGALLTARLTLNDLGRPQHVDSSRARAVLGFRPRGLEEIVTAIADSMLERGVVSRT